MGNNNYCCITRPKPEPQKPSNPPPVLKPNPKKKKPPRKKKNPEPSLPQIPGFPTCSPKSQIFNEDFEQKPENSTLINSVSLSNDLKESSFTPDFPDSAPGEKTLEKVQEDEEVFYIDLPKYSLSEISDLTAREKKEITWLLTQNSAEDEEIDGYLSVQKKNRYGFKQERWVLFTSHSLYLVIPHNFTICRKRFKISEIVNVYLDANSSWFCLEVLDKGFHVFYSKRTLDAVNAVQSLRFFLSDELKEILICQSENEIIKRIEKPVVALKSDLLFLKIKADYGFPGERLILDYDILVKNIKGRKEEIKLFLSTKNVYLVKGNRDLFYCAENKNILAVNTIDNSCEGVVRLKEGDIWVVSLNTAIILEDIRKVLLDCLGELIPFESVKLEEIKFKPLRQLKLSKNNEKKENPGLASNTING